MAKVYVFTPTCRYGGVDVTLASLQRQTFTDWCWIVSDDLFDEREEMWLDISQHVELIAGQSPPRRKDDYRNLAAAYNSAIPFALEDPEAVLFVTLQDYIWLPPEGLERFLKLNEKYPNDLLTGLCSISEDPYPDTVVNREGHFTIFADPYTDEPKVIGWSDIRNNTVGYREANHQEWEANWGAVPVSLLRKGLRWDREYDKGVAYENQDLAIQAITKFDSHIYLDCENHSLSLPHKSYFPEEEKRDVAHNNKEWHDKRWSERGFTP